MRLKTIAALLLAGLAPAADAQAPRPKVRLAAHRQDAEARPDILATAASTGMFRTLITAVVAADLVDDLRGKGPLTLFAPTDEAFAKLDKGTVEALLKPENKARLREVLLLHVAPGRLLARDLAGSEGPKTLAGSRLTIAANGHGLAVNEATVVKADILCGNGVVHVIDRVLTPARARSAILEAAEKAGNFTVLLAAIKAADLEAAFEGDKELTVFAPTDNAFAKLDKSTLKGLLRPEGKSKLQEILKYHVVGSRVTAKDAVSQVGVATLDNGKSVQAKLKGGRLLINGARVVENDVEAGRGLIHAIDSVLIPH